MFPLEIARKSRDEGWAEREIRIERKPVGGKRNRSRTIPRVSTEIQASNSRLLAQSTPGNSVEDRATNDGRGEMGRWAVCAGWYGGGEGVVGKREDRG